MGQGPLCEEDVRQMLQDAGCTPAQVQEILCCRGCCALQERLCLLQDYRRRLLARMHEEQHRLECLDQLIFWMKHGG